MQAGQSGDVLNTLYGQPRYKDKILYKCVFLFGMELRILFKIDEQYVLLNGEFIIPVPIIVSFHQSVVNI
jgi:hypothetical protein